MQENYQIKQQIDENSDLATISTRVSKTQNRRSKRKCSFLDVSGTDEKATITTNDIAQVQTKGVINEPED